MGSIAGLVAGFLAGLALAAVTALGVTQIASSTTPEPVSQPLVEYGSR
jgi:hypothetical protein